MHSENNTTTTAVPENIYRQDHYISVHMLSRHLKMHTFPMNHLLEVLEAVGLRSLKPHAHGCQ